MRREKTTTTSWEWYAPLYFMHASMGVENEACLKTSLILDILKIFFELLL